MEIEMRPKISIKSSNGFESDTIMETSRYTLSDILPISRFTKKMSTSSVIQKPDNFNIEVVTEDDSDEVLRLLKKFFFKDEPLNTYLTLGECKELEDYSTKCIHEGCSFKAVSNDGDIIGVFLNGIYTRPGPDDVPTKLADDCKHEKFKKILGLMDYIDTQFNIFDCFPDVNTILDGKILSVNSNYRGYGIAGHLTNRTMEYMRENKIPLMSVMCSSHYSARVMQKLDFEEVFAVKYADYTVDNKQPLLPAEPHTHCRIVAKRIN